MTKIINTSNQIIVQGVSYDMDDFKIHYFEECEIPGILRVIEEVGEFANEGYEDMDSIVRDSPLHHIEGLIRHQLVKHKIEEHGLSLKYLETTADFFIIKDSFHNKINCYKLVFLFDFLSDIVCLSQSPSDINSESLNKIAMNLRTLFILCDSSFTGASSHKEDVGFRHFAFSVWVGMGAKKISGRKFWDRAIYILNHEKYDGEVDISIMRRLGFNREEERVDYVAKLDLKKGRTVIKISCKSHDNLDEKAKGNGEINKIWRKLEDGFIKSYKKNGYPKHK